MAKTKNLPMEFNPGLKKYEPSLPLKKSNKKPEMKVDWKWIILLCLIIILLLGGIYLISR